MVEEFKVKEERDLQRIKVLEERLAAAEKSYFEQSCGTNDSSFSEPQLRKIQYEFSPESVFQHFNSTEPSRTNDRSLQGLEMIEKKYRLLFEEFQATAAANVALKKQLKRHKSKVLQWQTFLSGDSSQKVGQNPMDTNTDQILSGRSTLTSNISQPTAIFSESKPPLQQTPVANDAMVPLLDQASFPMVETRPESVDTNFGAGVSLSNPVSNSPRPPSQPWNLPLSHSKGRSQPEACQSSNRTRSLPTTPKLATAKAGFLTPRREDPEDHVIIKREACSPNVGVVEPSSSATQDLDQLGSPVKTPRKQFTVFMDGAPFSEPSTKLSDSHHSVVLQQSSGNAKRVPDKAVTSRAKRIKLSAKDGLKFPPIENMAEDGDGESLRSTFARKKRKTSILAAGVTHENTFADQRLVNLLETPMNHESRKQVVNYPEDAKISSLYHDKHLNKLRTSGPGIEKSEVPNKGGELQRISTERHQDEQGAAGTNSPLITSLGFQQALAENHPNVPYRQRPPHTLSLDNFKINPEQNCGLDFAFSEVVRGRDQRKCLLGCMREECCGSIFRALARVGDQSYPPQELSTDGPGNEDQHLIERYFDCGDQVLEGLSREQRQNMLVEIKARMLANKFGKHRSVSDRPCSPPGFWRTDMPTSQEVAQDHQRAGEEEKGKVMERYIEALRPGGFWKFADE